MKKQTNKTIKQRLVEHLQGDGTLNDLDTDALYREAHGLSEDVATDLEAVERWAARLAGTNTSAPWRKHQFQRHAIVDVKTGYVLGLSGTNSHTDKENSDKLEVIIKALNYHDALVEVEGASRELLKWVSKGVSDNLFQHCAKPSQAEKDLIRAIEAFEALSLANGGGK